MMIIISTLIFFLLSLPSVALPWLSTSSTSIINDRGGIVILKGVNLSNNVWGNWEEGVSEKLQKAGKDPLIRPKQQDPWVLTDQDFLLISGLGGNVVRYAINHELFAKDNKFRPANLEKLKEHVKRFNQSNIYVIISLHLPEGLDVQNDNYERLKPGRERILSIFENEEYWRNTLEMWTYLAGKLKDEEGVAGYELFNEPRLPCEKNGGLKNFRKKYNELCLAIRKTDQKHILFIPAYNSRETNPGEQYWDDAKKALVLDQGEEGIVWGQDFVKVLPEVKNWAYAFHVYEPYSFTHLGNSLFDESSLIAYINGRVICAKKENVPLIVTEYGVNKNQPPEKAIKYLGFLHKLFNENHISAVYFEYKSKAGASISPFHRSGIYNQYVDAGNEMSIHDGKYTFKPWAREAAKANGFDKLFKQYFWNNGKIIPISITDNGPIKKCLAEFCQKDYYQKKDKN